MLETGQSTGTKELLILNPLLTKGNVMKKIIILTATAAALTLANTSAFASSATVCGNTTGQWMSHDAVKEIASGQGYDVRRVKREDGCYEVYAIGKNGKRVELYMNPVTGRIVKTKTKS